MDPQNYFLNIWLLWFSFWCICSKKYIVHYYNLSNSHICPEKEFCLTSNGNKRQPVGISSADDARWTQWPFCLYPSPTEALRILPLLTVLQYNGTPTTNIVRDRRFRQLLYELIQVKHFKMCICFIIRKYIAHKEIPW